MAPLEKEVRNLIQGMQAVKDEQEYIVVRERVHRNTAESTNDRVKWWSIGQTIMLFAVCAWQVWYLKVCCITRRSRRILIVHFNSQSFFEVKRVI